MRQHLQGHGFDPETDRLLGLAMALVALKRRGNEQHALFDIVR